MKERKQKEKDFHNVAFDTDVRQQTAKFYSIVRSSKTFYKNLLLSHCQNKNVLEYGCGPSSYAYSLTKKNAWVNGIDISEIAIRQAKERAQEEQIERTNFFVMDAEALAFSNNTFDLVCGTGILHHLNIKQAYSEIARTLKTDGIAFFIEPLGHNPLINIYRKLTPALRTEDESPLLMTDFHVAKSYFKKVEIHFFHFTSLIAILFRKMPGFSSILAAFDATDTFLFQFLPFTKRYAWQAVIVLSKPTRDSTDDPSCTPT